MTRVWTKLSVIPRKLLRANKLRRILKSLPKIAVGVENKELTAEFSNFVQTRVLNERALKEDNLFVVTLLIIHPNVGLK